MILLYRGTSTLHQVYVFHTETYSRTDWVFSISKRISDRIAKSDMGSILTFHTLLSFLLTLNHLIWSMFKDLETKSDVVERNKIH